MNFLVLAAALLAGLATSAEASEYGVEFPGSNPNSA